MTIQVAEPKRKEPRNDFSELYASLNTYRGTWLRVPLAEISGSSDANKRMVTRQSLSGRGLTVETRIEGEYLFVRAPQNEAQVEYNDYL